MPPTPNDLAQLFTELHANVEANPEAASQVTDSLAQALAGVPAGGTVDETLAARLPVAVRHIQGDPPTQGSLVKLRGTAGAVRPNGIEIGTVDLALVVVILILL